MFIKFIRSTPVSVTVAVAPDGGEGEERFLLSLGEWRRLNRAFGYDPDAELFLSEGQPVDEALYDRMRAAHERTAALRDSASLLSSSDKSRVGLMRRLMDRGHSRDAARYALAVLEKKGLLDETSACLRYAESAVRRDHLGRHRILAALCRRGYSKEDAIKAASSVSDGDYRAALRWQIERHAPALLDSPCPLGAEEQRKAFAALLRRGFLPEEIRSVIEEGVGGDEGDGEARLF